MTVQYEPTLPFAPHWAAKYIGLPFVIGARGPKRFDCWGLIREIYQREKGIALGEFPGVSALQESEYEKALHEEIATNWKEIQTPENFSVVCLGTAGERFFHMGLWIELNGQGCVLHTREKVNAVIDTIPKLRVRMMTIKKCYKYTGGQNVLAH